MEEISSFWVDIMALRSIYLIFAFALLLGSCCGADVRLVDAAGGLSNAGLLQVKTDTGYGSVCGANAASAEVTRQEHVCVESVQFVRDHDHALFLHCAGGALGQGDLPIDGLCTRVNQQLPLFVLRRRRFVRRSWHHSGAPILCIYVCGFDACFCRLRPWQI